MNLVDQLPTFKKKRMSFLGEKQSRNEEEATTPNLGMHGDRTSSSFEWSEAEHPTELANAHRDTGEVELK